MLQPLIRVVSGGDEVTAGAFTIRDQDFDWAASVNAVIAFLLTAAVLYVAVVLPMNKLAERRKRGEQPPPEQDSEQVRLLREIRDALVAARVPEQSRATGQPTDR